MTRRDLNDATFIVPVRIENELRLANLRLMVRYVQHHFHTNVLVAESAPRRTVPESAIPGCRYFFLEDDRREFHRTRVLNFLTRQTETPYVVNCDADVLVPPQNLMDAMEALRTSRVDFCFPHSGMFYNVPRRLHPVIESSMDLSGIDVRECTVMHERSVGGIVCMSRASFVECGMENEHFVSWGPEDLERVRRWQKFEKRIGKVVGGFYHLDHSRHENSSGQNPFYERNDVEYHKVSVMSRDELIRYMGTWDWLKEAGGPGGGGRTGARPGLA
jgi:hypothetical protein